MVQFLNLPPEIINYILHDLPPPTLLSCQLINKFLNHTIRDSVILQNQLALTRACAEDNPLSHQITADKLASLKSSEDAWIQMHVDFVLRQPVPLRQSGVYDLTGGIYVLSNADRTGLGLMRLPENNNNEVGWTMYHVGKTIIDIGLCVYEHDLMAIVTSMPRIGTPMIATTYDIQVDFVELSTRKPHPWAHQNPLFVMNSSWEKPAVGIEIVGKHLVLVLSFNGHGHPKDRVYVFDWKTGTSIASFEAKSHTYAGLLFLDTHHFLLPNTRNNSLDIYKIPSAPTLEPLIPILILSLPPLIEGRILGFVTCRAEPNPIAEESWGEMRARVASCTADDTNTSSSSSGPNRAPNTNTNTSDTNAKDEDAPINLIPTRGFLHASTTALCMFELRVHVLQYDPTTDEVGFPFGYSFSFAIPRSAFLDLIAQHGWNEEAQSTSATETESGTKNEHPTGSTNVAAPSPAPTPLPAFTTLLYTPHQRLFHPSRPRRAWKEWGEDVSQWWGGNEGDVSGRWVTNCCGRRCVRMGEGEGIGSAGGGGGLGVDGEEGGERYYVYEFGGVAKASKKPEEEDMDEDDTKGDEKGEKEDKGKGKAIEDEPPLNGDGSTTNPANDPKPQKRKRPTAREFQLEAEKRRAEMRVEMERQLEIRMQRQRERRRMAQAQRESHEHGEGLGLGEGERGEKQGERKTRVAFVAHQGGPASGSGTGASGSGSGLGGGSGLGEGSSSGSYAQHEAAAIAESIRILDEMERKYGTNAPADSAEARPSSAAASGPASSLALTSTAAPGSSSSTGLGSRAILASAAERAEASNAASYARRATEAISGSMQILDDMERKYGTATSSTLAGLRTRTETTIEYEEEEIDEAEAQYLRKSEHGHREGDEDEEMDIYDRMHADLEFEELELQTMEAATQAQADGGPGNWEFLGGEDSADEGEDEDGDGNEEGARGVGAMAILSHFANLHGGHDEFMDIGADSGSPNNPTSNISADEHEHDHNHNHNDHADEEGEEEEEDESWALDPVPGPDENMLVVDYERVLDCPEVFVEPIYHRLPYVVRASRTRHRWSGVLLDEERVIGIYSDDQGHVENIEIHHFAMPDTKLQPT